MINQTGNHYDYWPESGIDDKEHFLLVACCGYQKLMTHNLTKKRLNGRLDYQLIYIINGRGYFWFDGEYLEVSKGNVVIYKPNEEQNYYYNAEDGTELYWLHFSGSMAASFLETSHLSKMNVYHIGINQNIIDVFKDIIFELQLKQPLYENLAAAHLIQMFSEIGRSLKSQSSSGTRSMQEDISKVISLIHKDYNKNLTMVMLAKESNLSLFRFMHKFKEVTGQTPLEYLTQIRINEAKKLLSDSNMNVSEVSTIVGYNNPLYFSRIFRKSTGIPPSKYKSI